MDRYTKMNRQLASAPSWCCSVYTKTTNTAHLVDGRKYKRVSKSRTLCGFRGKKVWQPTALYWAVDRVCLRCLKKSKEQYGASQKAKVRGR